MRCFISLFEPGCRGNKAGIASALATTCSDLGISLGIAIIGSVGPAVYRA
ncbi:hypothetical protein [Nonomuraea recticatena]|uniref:Uncharacterized protein n=1 Tax=Nonomuraea recticatena TaxID=46178 RepID=A0ABN3TGK2_9ACTN